MRERRKEPQYLKMMGNDFSGCLKANKRRKYKKLAKKFRKIPSCFAYMGYHGVENERKDEQLQGS